MAYNQLSFSIMKIIPMHFFLFFFFGLPSCQNNSVSKYKEITFSISKFLTLPEQLNECSGMVYENDELILINDGGDGSILYKLKMADEQIFTKIEIKDSKNIDWETLISYNNEYLVGDFGNNEGGRKDLRIYHIDKKDFDVNKKIKFNFVDKKDKKKKNHDLDCEAMIVMNKSYYLFTKNANNKTSSIYSAKLGKEKFDFECEIDVPSGVTDAYYHEKSKSILLLCHNSSKGIYKNYVVILKYLEKGKFETIKTISIDFPEQFEALTLLKENEFLIGSEVSDGKGGNVYKIEMKGL